MTTKLTNFDKKELFIEAYLKSNCNVSEACKSINMNRTTFYDWLKADESFREQVTETNDKLIDLVESKLIEKIKAGDITAIIFFLKTKGKKRGWNERQQEPDTKDREINITVIPPAGVENEPFMKELYKTQN